MTVGPASVAFQTPDCAALYDQRILPGLGVARGGAENPQWIFVCGQPGSGKTTLIRQLAKTLGPDRTQRLSSDALSALLPELYRDPSDPEALAAQDAFTKGPRQGYIDALVDRAAGLGAHVIWERPTPTDTAELAIVARAMGYRVDCRVLAVPLLESWLATLLRETAAPASPGQIPRRVAWANQQVTYGRWPAFLAQAEDRVVFDSLQVIGRDGQVFFQNDSTQTGAARRWRDPPFAFESLLVERLAPRSPAQVDRLIADWQGLLTQPDIGFRNHEAWPFATIAALGRALCGLRDDPTTGFDLTRAAEAPSPKAASAWLARLRAEVAAMLALPEAQSHAPLAPRCDRFLQLVERTLQPTR